MAFQTGTRVDPRLGALDFSGFTNAANIQAQALSNLGATIGGAIAANKEKKKEKALTESAAQMVLNYSNANPDVSNQLGIKTLEDAKIAVKTLGGAEPTLSFLMEVGDPGDAPTASEITSVARLLDRPEFSNIKFDETTGEAFMEVPNKETLRPFDKRRVPVPKSIQNLPGFDEFAKMQRTTSKPQDFEKMGMRVVE